LVDHSGQFTHKVISSVNHISGAKQGKSPAKTDVLTMHWATPPTRVCD